MNEAITIAVRRRPSDQENPSHSVKIEVLDKNVLVLEGRPFVFDKIIEPEANQAQVYEDLIKPLVQKFLNGFYCTILAYGQTGTGKTYTMGLQSNNFDTENAGIVSRALNEIFTPCDSEKQIFISFVEIYNEKAFDLLSSKPDEQINVKGCKFAGATKRRVFSLDDAKQTLLDGNKNRHVRPTKMNESSSRSHAIFTVSIEIKHESIITRSSLNLVDLAGSEGVRRTDHRGAALVEGNHINQGLLSIGKVIHALSQGFKVIPYRDSVLSSVLQNSLNSNSYLTLLACVSSLKKDFTETISTLRFARNTKGMKNTPQINAIIAEYKRNSPAKVFKSPMTMHMSYQTPGFQRPRIVTSTVVSKPPRFSTLETSNKKSFVPKRQSEMPKSQNSNAKQLFTTSQVNSTATNATLNITDSIGCSILDVSTTTDNGEKPNTVQSPYTVDQPTTISTTAYSPIVRRCMKEFESMLESKMKPFFNTINILEQNQAIHATLEEETLRQSENKENINNDETVFKVPQIPTKINTNEPKSHKTVDALHEIRNTENDHDNELKDEIHKHRPILRRSKRISNRIELPEKPNEIVAMQNLRRSSRISILALRQDSTVAEPRPRQQTSPGIASSTNRRTISKHDRKLSISKVIKNMEGANSPTEAKAKHKEFVLKILNTGDLKELQVLSQVGQKTAFQIITHRTLHGKFKDIESVSKIPWRGKTFARFIVSNNLD